MSTARDEMIERLAASLFEADEVLTSWHNSTPEDAEEYRGIAAIDVDAFAAAVRAEVLREAAQQVETVSARPEIRIEDVRFGMRCAADLLRIQADAAERGE